MLSVAVISINASAKIWRINNNPGVMADFSDPQNAINSASVHNDDTLYFEASPTVYNGFTLTKRLVLIGLGYFINGSYVNPGLQASTTNAVLSSLTIDTLGSGSQIIGLEMPPISANTSGVGADNITFTRCYLGFFNGGATPQKGYVAKNWKINKCFIAWPFYGYSINPDSWQITNSIFLSSFVLNSPNTINCLLRNNFFNQDVQIFNVYFANNIIPSAGFTRSNCTVKNNTSTGSAFTDPLDLANGNNNESVASVFIGGNPYIDNYYRLNPTYESSAAADGETVNGVTVKRGPFGTADPYRLSGIPAIPSIYTFTVPASVASTATTMPVTISTRSNN